MAYPFDDSDETVSGWRKRKSGVDRQWENLGLMNANRLRSMALDAMRGNTFAQFQMRDPVFLGSCRPLSPFFTLPRSPFGLR